MTSGVPDGAATWAAEVTAVIVRTIGRERSINGLLEISVIETEHGVHGAERESPRGEIKHRCILPTRATLTSFPYGSTAFARAHREGNTGESAEADTYWCGRRRCYHPPKTSRV